MKKILLALFTILLVGCTGKMKYIEHPQFQTSNTNTVYIRAIETNDTATILSMDVYNHPNYWVKIVSHTRLEGNETGKHYKLLRSEGFELDKEVYMPESGTVSCKLYFEKLDDAEESINFVEGDSEGAFQISGISLLPPQGKVCCRIEGVVENRPQTNRLILLKPDADPRLANWISIPVRDGKFSYTLYDNEEKVYTLTPGEQLMRGIYYPFNFFAENGTVNITVHEKDDDLATITTTNPLQTKIQQLNADRKRLFPFDGLYARRDSLRKEGKYYSDEYMDWDKRISKTTRSTPREEMMKLWKQRDELEATGRQYSQQGTLLEAEMKALADSALQWEREWARQDASLAGLYVIKRNVSRMMSRANNQEGPWIEAYKEVYQDKYPNHSYSADLNSLIENEAIEVGKPYIDFVAQDLEGNDVRLSEQIKGKYAWIDLWASWCGSCRYHSKQMIPVYEKYKDKGFTVVGVARERNNDKAMRKAIEKEGFPWLNLIELDDRNHIWQKYRIENAAGGTYLVNPEGIVLAIGASAEEVDKILAKEMN